MDMVGEGLRQNNSVFRMSECPGHLPSYLDGLAQSIMNYVWRTNDMIFHERRAARPARRAVFPDPDGGEERLAGRVPFRHAPDDGRQRSHLLQQPVGRRAGRDVHRLARPVVSRRHRHARQVGSDAVEAGGVHRRRLCLGGGPLHGRRGRRAGRSRVRVRLSASRGARDSSSDGRGWRLRTRTT